MTAERIAPTPPAEAQAEPVDERAEMTERDHWDYSAWQRKLAELADAYYEAGRTSPAKDRARAELLFHALDCATGWRARSAALSTPAQPAQAQGEALTDAQLRDIWVREKGGVSFFNAMRAMRAALAAATPPAPPAVEPSSLPDDRRLTLVHALMASKGWMRSYAEAFVDDFAAPQPQAAQDAAALLDPTVVHAAMLRGHIATPTIRTVLHVQGNGALEAYDAMVQNDARYRWLRDKASTFQVVSLAEEFHNATRWDAAIDAELRAGGASPSPSESSP